MSDSQNQDTSEPLSRTVTEPFNLSSRQEAIAQDSVAHDAAALGRSVGANGDAALSRSLTYTRNNNEASWGYSMAGSYRRPSFIVAGNSRSAFLPGRDLSGPGYLTKDEEEAVVEEERSLLRDNNIFYPKHPRRKSSVSGGRGLISALRRRASRGQEETMASQPEDGPSESTPLFAQNGVRPAGDPSLPYGGQDDPENVHAKWEEAVSSGKIQTTWQREAKIIGRYSRSLILTFMLQYSLTVVSVFAVGRIGVVELGAVSLGSMTTNITGYAVIQGLATSLDTLCAQAYGSGQHKLVGLQMQRMVLFLWAILIPIGAIWLSGSIILKQIVPNPQTAELAGLYLKVALIGAPGYAAFEAGKRFVQAQGMFTANLYVLLIAAPLNVFLHWLLVWQVGLGFVGAPLAVAITETIMPILLALYIRYIGGSDCWGGFSKSAFKNWWPMVKLALPGLVMVLAEYLAFEILTFAASWISTKHLAAQSVLSTVLILTYQIPFPISVAASTRIANLIGATLPEAGKMAAKVVLTIAVGVGFLNMAILSSLRFLIPKLFTDDEDVIAIVAHVLPLCAAFQLFDSLAASCNGILRGIGRQEVGGYIAIAAYYGVAMPASFGLCFGAKWDVMGLWTGPLLALFLVASIEAVFISKADWQRAVEESRKRIISG